MLILFFSFSLVKIDECYLRPYPRGLGIGFLLTLLFGLICLIVSAFLPFCVGPKHLSTLIFLVVGSIAIFASHCTLLSIVAYLGTGAGPRWVLAVGILSFIFAFETIYFAIFSRRSLHDAFLYRVERDY